MFDNEAEKTLGTLRKKLCIHNKLKLQIDKNDELSCWVIICRYDYKAIMRSRVKDTAKKYWFPHARVSTNARDVMR